MHQQPHCTAFRGTVRIATGPLPDVALQAKAALDADETASILIFDDVTAEPIEVDFRGSPQDVLRRLESGSSEPRVVVPPRRGPGRPKLGVVAREVTLLPRHWAWLRQQPGGASVALRKLVEAAKRKDSGGPRQAQEATYRFMVAMAGNEAGFEEAARALFAGSKNGFDRQIETWPPDVRDHALALADRAFAKT
jgi:hypothetical protein